MEVKTLSVTVYCYNSVTKSPLKYPLVSVYYSIVKNTPRNDQHEAAL